MLREMGPDLGRNAFLPRLHLPDALDQVLRRHALQNIAWRPRLESAPDFDVAFERRQHDDARIGKLRADCDHRVDPAHVGKPQIHQGHVRAVLAETQEGLAAAPGLGHELHVPLTLDQSSDPLSKQWVVVYAENTDRILLGHSALSLPGFEIPRSSRIQPRQPPPRPPAGPRLKSDAARHGKLDFRAAACPAPNPKVRADPVGPFAHAREPPVSLPSGVEKLRIDPAAIITDRDSQSLGGELDLDLDPVRSRMLERIDHRFAPDPVDLVPDDGVERARLAFTDDTEIDSFLRVQLLADSREGLFEIGVVAAGRTQPSDGVASLFDHTPHQL